MPLPGWNDDELLLGELRDALHEPPVDESVIQAAQAAFSWRTVDADLEILGLDADAGLAAAGSVRGSGSGSPRAYTFHGEHVRVAVEIDADGIAGQLTPPGAWQITLVCADSGETAATQADEVGYFTLPPPPPGPVRLDCRLDAIRFRTEWTTLRVA